MENPIDLHLMRQKSKAALLVFSIILLLAAAPPAHAQSALDAFNPGVNDNIHTVVVQPDGKILIGGEFVQVQPNGAAAVTRKRMARLNPDGTSLAPKAR